jgi:hypothetical protein
LNLKDINLFERLYYISVETLATTHPFPNNNFMFTSIFLDLLLIRENYLPIWMKRTFKDNGIFRPTKKHFYEIILLRYQNYIY